MLGPGGKLAVNTGGGQLSAYYMWGMTPLSEAIIQARGGKAVTGRRMRTTSCSCPGTAASWIITRRWCSAARRQHEQGTRGMSVGPVQRDEATAEFFDGAAAGQFLLRQCAEGHFSEPAAAACTACGRDRAGLGPGGGRRHAGELGGQLERASGDAPAPRTVLVIGELDEGPWWWAQLRRRRPEAAELAAGQRLRVEFRRADGEYEAVPVFVLA